MQFFRVALIVLSVIPALHAQAAFEAASVRPSTILANGRYGNYKWSGGPGTSDPNRMILENFDIRSLITKAYDIPMYRFSGPEWLFDIKLDVTAIIPAGTTNEQFLVMQQNLLATRLGLVVHREKKEMPIYELVIAKGGSKLKEAAPPQGDIAWPAGPLKKDDDGFPVLPPGHTTYAFAMNHARLQGAGETMEHFVSTLTGQLSAPVVDVTGLTGKYDFTLKWIAGNLRPEDDPGLSLESALPQQLGLTLRHSKGQIEVLVVDHVEKTPTEN
jgi:uncharacterized protein (TIGR03435 family)